MGRDALHIRSVRMHRFYSPKFIRTMPEASANDKWYRPYIIGAGAVGLGIATYVFFPAALPIIKAKALLAGKGAMAGGLKVVKLAGTATKFMVVVKAGMAVGRLIIEVTQVSLSSMISLFVRADMPNRTSC